MLQFKDIKEGSRIVIAGKRCVVRTLLKNEMIVDPIAVDVCTDVPIGLSVSCCDDGDVMYSEWGVTKTYKVTLTISVNHDYTDSQPVEDALQEGLDQYDGSMLITEYDLMLVEVTDNDVPVFDKAKKIAELKETIKCLIRELEKVAGT